jgi:tRNA threonylcarbamoyl adenosine modification protein YjeE
MPELSLTLDLPDAAATDRLGRALATRLRAGDAVALSGPVGAGKTHLARAVIQALRAGAGEAPEDVPSPSYTLVQTYRAGGLEIWHADLYRLGEPGELDELGLGEALGGGALLMVEWPDRLGPELPARALTVTLAAEGQGRRARLTGPPPWDARLAGLSPEAPPRAPEVARFLDLHGWGGAARAPLAGDASSRRYERLSGARGRAVLMDAPPDADPVSGGDQTPFVALARRLARAGLSAPAILAADPARGLVAMEDLGDALFSHHLAAHPGDEATLYVAAAEALAAMQARADAGDLASWTDAMPALATLAVDWYAPERRALGPDLAAALAEALDRLGEGRDVLVHRDWHADNLIWLPERAGVARVGVLDFQDAMRGWREYDVTSYLDDARRDVGAPARAQAWRRWLELTGVAAGPAEARLALCRTQRALRILGVFARLSLRDGKASYPRFIPRSWAHLQAALAHPALADLARVAAALPAPDAARLAGLRAQAGRFAGRDDAAGLAA